MPRDTPCLIVGNHSGGAESNDFAFLLYKWVAGTGRHGAAVQSRPTICFSACRESGSALRRLGSIPASHANAHKALAMGAAVSVFPGGDHEVFRPWRERNRIDFGGRTGFITLAIAAAVPVVPMTIHGAHESTLVLTRGRGLAHAAGIDRLHVNVFPFIWNIPFGPTPAFVPSLQLPSKVTVHFGAPLDWSQLQPPAGARSRRAARLLRGDHRADAEDPEPAGAREPAPGRRTAARAPAGNLRARG